MAYGKKTGGRIKGTPNKRTQGIEALAATIIEDPRYIQNLKERALSGLLAPGMETLLFHYRYGKPREQHADDYGLMADLVGAVLQHVESREGRAEIRAILEKHAAGPPGLRVVA